MHMAHKHVIHGPYNIHHVHAGLPYSSGSSRFGDLYLGIVQATLAPVSFYVYWGDALSYSEIISSVEFLRNQTRDACLPVCHKTVVWKLRLLIFSF